jgi:hypothetical protein
MIYLPFEKIIKEWGDRPLASIDSTEVTTFLFAKDRSGQWKNRYKKIFSEIYDEAKSLLCGLIITIPPERAEAKQFWAGAVCLYIIPV